MASEGVERRAHDRDWKRADRRAHPDKYRAIDRTNRLRKMATNPQRERERVNRWYIANPMRVPWLAWRNSRARAIKFGVAVGTVTVQDIARIRLLPCTYCGASPAAGVDHVVPFAKGGSNELDNLAPSCLSCNRRKFTNERPG